jgi:hypothetical protein
MLYSFKNKIFFLEIFIFSNLLVVETFERDDVENGVIFVSGIPSIMN